MKRILLALSLLVFSKLPAQLCMSPAISYQTDSFACTLTTADFNADGIPDIATANYHQNKNISILLGAGGGTFTYHTYLNAGNTPNGITSADFNNDGKTDLAVTNNTGQSVSIFKGTGGGNFSLFLTMTTGNSPNGIASADLDLDGNADLVVGNYYTGEIYVFAGSGNGNFGFAQTYTVGYSPDQILVKDLNTDGHPDLVVNCHSGTASVLLGGSNMVFSNPVSYLASALTSALTLADFNGDGKYDIASAGQYYNDVTILFGDGAGGFPTTQSFTVNVNPTFIAAGDFDLDGKMDLVIPFQYMDSIAIYLGNGQGGFGAPNYFTTGPGWVLPGDYDLDGRTDLAIAGGQKNISVLLNCSVVGVSEHSNVNNLSIYPNPGRGTIYAESDQLIERLKVSNSLGQLVFEERPDVTRYSFQLNTPGIYFVTIFSGQSLITKKVIVE